LNRSQVATQVAVAAGGETVAVKRVVGVEDVVVAWAAAKRMKGERRRGKMITFQFLNAMV
jgi:hypothetical protein